MSGSRYRSLLNALYRWALFYIIAGPSAGAPVSPRSSYLMFSAFYKLKLPIYVRWPEIYSPLQEIYAREKELLQQVTDLVTEAHTTLDGQNKQLSNLKTQFQQKVGFWILSQAFSVGKVFLNFQEEYRPQSPLPLVITLPFRKICALISWKRRSRLKGRALLPLSWSSRRRYSRSVAL